MRNNSLTSKERLEHILQAIGELEGATREHTKERFLENRILINACLYQFAIIGEAIVHVDHDILQLYPYPWHKVRSFRNFIVHEYHAIEFRIVWSAIEKDLPELKKTVQTILENEFYNP